MDKDKPCPQKANTVFVEKGTFSDKKADFPDQIA